MACFPRFTDHQRVLVRAKQIQNNPEYDTDMYANKDEGTPNEI